MCKPAAMPMSAPRASPGPLTTQPMTATWIGSFRSSSASWAALATADHVDLGPAARRAGDEVEALALAQPQRLEELAPGLGLLDRVGGQRVADGVADALGEQGPDAGGALQEPGRRRARLGHPEVQRVVEGLRRPAGRPRS